MTTLIVKMQYCIVFNEKIHKAIIRRDQDARQPILYTPDKMTFKQLLSYYALDDKEEIESIKLNKKSNSVTVILNGNAKHYKHKDILNEIKRILIDYAGRY